MSEDKLIFAMYYASIVSVARYHPGNRKEDEIPDLDELATEALVMVRITNALGEKLEWQ
jgi:hypothetical protein